MARSVSIVEARRELGRLAEDVRRTGRPVVLTRRGRPVATLVPEPSAARKKTKRSAGGFGALQGTVKLNCSLEDLQRAIRRLRREFTDGLERRAALITPPNARPRA